MDVPEIILKSTCLSSMSKPVGERCDFGRRGEVPITNDGFSKHLRRIGFSDEAESASTVTSVN